ncbi:MAG TPA: response regulator [Albitalea sp.]|uniref:response regulator n=1 Tax=Piscinibacter sp. TaxID=1903157 RepID=UPI002ED60AD5
MEQLTGALWQFVAGHVGWPVLLIVLLAAVALYGWHQFQRAHHLAEVNEHERRRSQQALEEIERLKRDDASTPPRADRRQASSSGERRKRSSSRVLVVEDDEVMQSIIPAMLSRCLSGAEIRVQQTAREALAELQRFQPELLVLDLRLQRESGLQLLEALRELNASLPVLVYSGHDDEIEQLRSVRGSAGLGNITILQKGSDLEVFMRIVPSLFRRRASDRDTSASPAAAASPRERRVGGERRSARRPFTPGAALRKRRATG